MVKFCCAPSEIEWTERNGEANLKSVSLDLAGMHIQNIAQQINFTTANVLAVATAFLYSAAREKEGTPMQQRNNHGKATTGHRSITWAEFQHPWKLALRFLGLIADPQKERRTHVQKASYGDSRYDKPGIVNMLALPTPTLVDHQAII